jgi:type VI secretion system protein ImpL
MLRRILAHRWILTLIACLLLAAVIYFIGPSVAIGGWQPLAGDWAMWSTIGLLFLIWAAAHGFLFWRKLRRERALSAGLTSAEDPAAAEVALLRQRIEASQARLKEVARGSGKTSLCDLPWYILIGPPGAGKTTALLKSGLRFIGADGKNPPALRGVGGTRNCDWLFAEQAVLVDTAGRFTTQDSNHDADRATWLGFLKLLKEQRPRQPINGALVAVSLPELASMSEAARLEHAQTIRSRVQELRTQLAIDFPVYVMFTKLDLLNGFNEFFATLSKEERSQVWGLTLPAPTRKGERPSDLAGQVTAGLDDLLTRLSGWMLDRVHDEADPNHRSLVHGFPLQLTSLRGSIEEFVEAAFGPSRYDQAALLRGFYFTSGVQEGTPVDRILGMLSRSFGVSFTPRGGIGGSGRSYFIADLLEKVVFPEAELVGLDPKVEQRMKWLHLGSYAACGTALAAALVLWGLSTFGNYAMIEAVAEALPPYRAAVSPLVDRPIVGPDLAAIRQPLLQLRDLAGLDGRKTVLLTGFGLSQASNLDEGGHIAYRNGLNTMLLPRLMLQLGQYLRDSADHPETRYQVLKAYLMLGGQAPAMQRSFLERAFKGIWEQNGVEASFSIELAKHLSALLDGSMSSVTIDQPLVDRTRDQLKAIKPALRAYSAIKDDEGTSQLKDWVLLDHAGINAERVLTLRSKTELQKATIPGLFTRDGFYHVVLPSSATMVEEIALDQWVLGDTVRVAPEKIREIEQGVIAAYETEFIEQWDKLLADIAIKPFETKDEGADTLTILAGPSSPFRTLFPDMVKETQLTKPPEEAAVAAIIAPGKTAELGRIANQAERLVQAAGYQGAKPGAAVEAHFLKLAQYTGTGSGSSQMDGTMRQFGQAADQLRRLDTPGQDNSMSSALQTASSFQQLKNANDTPPQLGAMIGSIGQKASGLATNGARDQVRGDWNSSVLQKCTDTIEGRYPLRRDGVREIQPDDLVHVLGPGGLIENYFNQNLRSLVDVAGPVWRWKSGGGTDVGLGADFLVQIKQAARIKELFFLNGSTQFGFHATITPKQLDQDSTSAELEIDGQTIGFRHDAQRPVKFSWPGPGGTGEIRLAFQDAKTGQTSSISAHGPWSWYRFVDQGQTSSASEKGGILLTFQQDGHSVTYEVQGTSAQTPLTLQNVGEFHCPKL